MRIAVLCLPGIGDSLMATPMVRLLRKHYPKATIDVICMFDGVAYCFKKNPHINNVFRLNLYNEPLLKGLWEIISMRKYEYDVSILAFPAYRREYHIVQFLLGAKRRIAHKFGKGFWNEMNFLDTERINVDDTVHNSVNNLNLLKKLNIQWEKEKPRFVYDISIDKQDVAFGKQYIRNLGWGETSVIGIHPGSINSAAGIYKRWPVKNFAALTKALIKKKKKVLVFVGPFEIDLGEKIVNLVNDKKNCQLITKTTFGQSLGILKALDLLVTNDNGFSHIANALKIKEIVLFGPTNPIWCSPIDKNYATSLRNARFTPWFRNDMKVTHPPKGIRSGMSEISVENVLTELTKTS